MASGSDIRIRKTIEDKKEFEELYELNMMKYSCSQDHVAAETMSTSILRWKRCGEHVPVYLFESTKTDDLRSHFNNRVNTIFFLIFFSYLNEMKNKRNVIHRSKYIYIF